MFFQLTLADGVSETMMTLNRLMLHSNYKKTGLATHIQ